MLSHVTTHVRESDHLYDEAHGLQHCLTVLGWALQYFVPSNFMSAYREIFLVIAGCLLHEQFDTKFQLNLEENMTKVSKALAMDGFFEEEIKWLIVILKTCSFSKRDVVDNLPLAYRYIKQIISAADLLEATNANSLKRSYTFQKHQFPQASERELWQRVYNFYLTQFQERIDAIKVPRIKAKAFETASVVHGEMMAKVAEYHFTGFEPKLTLNVKN